MINESEDNKKKITVANVANAAINIFTQDCLDIAKNNWLESQVDMLQRLFEAVLRGCEYKCVGCEYLGKPSDAPLDTQEDCMWQPSDENGWDMPCEAE